MVWTYRKLFAGARAAPRHPHEPGLAQGISRGAGSLDLGVASAPPAPAAALAPAPAPAIGTAPDARLAPLSDGSREPALGWTELRARVAACTRCALSATRTQTVFGVGRHPGRMVDRRGGTRRRRGSSRRAVRRPRRAAAQFHVAGHRSRARTGLHRQCLEMPAAGKPRPGPARKRASACRIWSVRSRSLKPKIMLAVGRISAQNLLRTEPPWRECASRCILSVSRRCRWW